MSPSPCTSAVSRLSLGCICISAESRLYLRRASSSASKAQRVSSVFFLESSSFSRPGGDMGRYGEIRGDTGRAARSAGLAWPRGAPAPAGDTGRYVEICGDTRSSGALRKGESQRVRPRGATRWSSTRNRESEHQSSLDCNTSSGALRSSATCSAFGTPP